MQVSGRRAEEPRASDSIAPDQRSRLSRLWPGRSPQRGRAIGDTSRHRIHSGARPMPFWQIDISVSALLATLAMAYKQSLAAPLRSDTAHGVRTRRQPGPDRWARIAHGLPISRPAVSQHLKVAARRRARAGTARGHAAHLQRRCQGARRTARLCRRDVANRARQFAASASKKEGSKR